MYNKNSDMDAKAHQNFVESSRVEVGEIDTSAPFESVKAAVSMFGESAFSRYQPSVRKQKSNQESPVKIFAIETQLHLTQKELNKLKEQVKNCETTRVQALGELEMAKITFADLTQKLNIINQSREIAIKGTETANIRTLELEEVTSISVDADNGNWKQELDTAREQYAVTIAELNVAKQELRRIRKVFEASVDAKVSAIEKEEAAKQLANANSEQTGQLSKEIAAVQESVMHVRLASMQSKEEEMRILAEKDIMCQSYKDALEETEKKLASLKEEFSAELVANLEIKLAETTKKIELLWKEMENTRTSDLNLIATASTNLDFTKKALQEVLDEESFLKNLLESLNSELESVKRQHLELKEKEAGCETLAGDLHVKLQKSKNELEVAISGESKAREAFDDLMSTFEQLSSETENARKNAEIMKRNTVELMEEAKAAQIAVDEAEKKLYVALRDAQDAEMAEANALNQIKLLSDKANHSLNSSSESGANITITVAKLESLNQKVEKSQTLAEKRIAAAVAQVAAVRAGENEATKKLEAIHEELKELESAIKEALRNAEMAEAARRAIEGEIRKRRERKQKKEAEEVSQELSEREITTEALPSSTRILQPNLVSITSLMEKTTITKKTVMVNIGGLLRAKKNHADDGSPLYTPRDKSV